jgi:hypothetical protein
MTVPRFKEVLSMNEQTGRTASPEEADMTENTPGQQHLQAAAERVGEKLQRFYAALPADEQTALSLALHQMGARTSGPAEDVTGYFLSWTPWSLIFGGILAPPDSEADELIDVNWKSGGKV